MKNQLWVIFSLEEMELLLSWQMLQCEVRYKCPAYKNMKEQLLEHFFNL